MGAGAGAGAGAQGAGEQLVARLVRRRLPTPTRASHRQALEVPAGSAGASAAEQVAALREQLLSAAHLSAQREAVTAEVREMTYIP